MDNAVIAFTSWYGIAADCVGPSCSVAEMMAVWHRNLHGVAAVAHEQQLRAGTI